MTGFHWSFGDTSSVNGEAVGDVFAERFRVGELLGSGAMGQVFRAFDLAAQRPVAIKVLSGQVNERSAARFAREGELTASLRHSGILRVHGGGVTEDSRPFLVLELVKDARELTTAMKEAPERALEMLLDVARAVGYAHDQGIVHRDLKPENILVDASGVPRVCDFGLAWGQGLESLTKTGQLLGTPLFMPPEAFDAKTRHHGPTMDVWSLGVMLYHALTGAYPFLPTSTLVEYMAKVCRSEPEPPSRHDSNVPKALAAVCLRALAKKPADRYADGSAFADALDAAIHSGPESSSRAQLVVGGSAAVGLVVTLLVIALSSPEAPQPAPPPKVAVEAPQDPEPRDDSEELELLARGRALVERDRRLEALDIFDRLEAPPADLVWDAVLPEVKALLRAKLPERGVALLERPAPSRLARAQTSRVDERKRIAQRAIDAAIRLGQILRERRRAPVPADSQRVTDYLRVALGVGAYRLPREDALRFLLHSPAFMRDRELGGAVTQAALTIAQLAPDDTSVQVEVAALARATTAGQLFRFIPNLRRALELSGSNPVVVREMRYLLCEALFSVDPSDPEVESLTDTLLADSELALDDRGDLLSQRVDTLAIEGRYDEAYGVTKTGEKLEPRNNMWVLRQIGLLWLRGERGSARDQAVEFAQRLPIGRGKEEKDWINTQWDTGKGVREYLAADLVYSVLWLARRDHDLEDLRDRIARLTPSLRGQQGTPRGMLGKWLPAQAWCELKLGHPDPARKALLEVAAFHESQASDPGNEEADRDLRRAGEYRELAASDDPQAITPALERLLEDLIVVETTLHRAR